jgi:RNA polymerase sigma-70 factor (ECF subfamily)
MQADDDGAVIAQVLDGDVEQFAELVRRYQVRLYRYAVSMVGDHDVASDMVQDAFIRAYTNLAACRDRDRFRVWLFRTLRNRCFDHLKDPRRRQVPIEDAPPVPDEREGPADRVERAGLRAQLRRALDRLPAVQREAFLMHYVEGLSYEDMAGTLEASVSALKMRVLRAREALAVQLRSQEVTGTARTRLSIRRG